MRLSSMIGWVLICDCKDNPSQAGPANIPQAYEVQKDVVRRAGLHVHTRSGNPPSHAHMVALLWHWTQCSPSEDFACCKALGHAASQPSLHISIQHQR